MIIVNGWEMSTPEKRLLINLRIISSTRPHQKLNSKQELLAVEQPTWVPEMLYRFWRGDTREICLRRLEELVSEAVAMVEQAGRLNDKKKQNKFLCHLSNCIPGFHNLKQTYASDLTTVANLDLFIETCEDILLQYNYSPDRCVVVNELPLSDDDDTNSDTTDEDEIEAKKETPPRFGPKIGQESWRSPLGKVIHN